MALDMWTINLVCNGADGEKNVRTEMDRDEICYFNLIELIEQYGYTSVDYIYYRRKDGLIPIEQDPEVMDMLKECESQKMVSLFVTKSRLATLVPTKSNKEPSKSKPNKTKGRGGTKKKKRLNVMHTEAIYADEVEQPDDENLNTLGDGDEVPNKRKGTVLPHVWDLPDRDRIVVTCNILGQPIGKEGGLLGQFLGTIARNGGYCPVGAKDWRQVKKKNVETIIQYIQTKFLYPRSCEKWILKSIGRDWRKYKATLKKALFNLKKKKSVLNKRCPTDIEEDEWKALVNYWKSKEGKTLSEKNKICREMRKTTHTAGTKSYARWSEDMRQADPEKKRPHRSKVFLVTHKKRGEGINEPVVQLENLLDTQPELAENSEGRVAWEGDALHQVLGEEKAGQVHGMGLLPVPKQVYGQKSHHFKDIDIVSLDGSSSEVDTHMLEEIRKLKEHSRMQDKVIEELKNNQRHNENQEATMGNYARSDHNNSQNQMVHSNRKRVQCGAPDQNERFLKHRDDLNKEKCVPEFSDDDNLLLSGEKRQSDNNDKEIEEAEAQAHLNNDSRPIQFDSCRRTSATSRIISNKQKGRHGGPGETRTIAHQEVAHDKATSYKRHAHRQSPLIKVGSTVLLMSSKYPNKANVAYATLLSTDPEAIVGGVKTGRQFYKVRIDHPISKDEPLVRPTPGCNNIGEAHGKGVSIAWPLMFVCLNYLF